MKAFLVVRPSPRNEEPGRLRADIYFGDSFDTIEEAKRVAAIRAGITGDAHYVLHLVGTQQPVYDPEIGWVPAS